MVNCGGKGKRERADGGTESEKGKAKGYDRKEMREGGQRFRRGGGRKGRERARFRQCTVPLQPYSSPACMQPHREKRECKGEREGGRDGKEKGARREVMERKEPIVLPAWRKEFSLACDQQV